MLDLYEQGLSRTQRGGTLFSYATNLSHLIRYAYAQNTPFLNITDSQFGFFITTLLGERSHSGSKSREQNHVLNVARNCLQFIQFISNALKAKPSLTILEKEYVIKLSNGNQVKRTGLTHPAMPIEYRVSRRFPINSENIKKLRLAAHRDTTTSHFIKARTRVAIRALEMTGGRRLEVVLLTVDAVRLAKETGHLSVQSVKQGRKISNIQNSRTEDPSIFREIPISTLDIKLLNEFVDLHRNPLVRKFISAQEDHGFLFVSETTGKPLTANHITYELHKLRKLAKIEEPVSPHLFRHRFITKIFVAEILRSEINTIDNFKLALLNTETLKRKVCELTGHKDVRSLDTYIHLAWDEAEQIRNGLPNLSKLHTIEAIREQLTEFMASLGESNTGPELKALHDLIASFEAIL